MIDTSRYTVHPNAAWRRVDDHVFVITPDNRQHELFGEVETVVWEACAAGPQSIPDLARLIVETFDVEGEAAMEDITEFVASMVEAGLLDLAK